MAARLVPYPRRTTMVEWELNDGDGVGAFVGPFMPMKLANHTCEYKSVQECSSLTPKFARKKKSNL